MNKAGEILRNLRGEKSQEQIAREIGLTKSAWAMYERGERVPAHTRWLGNSIAAWRR